MLDVPDLADSRTTIEMHQSNFARRQPNLAPGALLRHQLSANAGGPRQLRPRSNLGLDTMDRRPQRDRSQGQAVAWLDIRTSGRDHRLTVRQANWAKNEALFSIDVAQQRDPGAPIRIVLNALYLRRNAHFVTPKIDNSELPLVSAAPKAGRNASKMISAARR
jgi:hypothetical protein